MTARAVITGGGIVCSLGVGRNELYQALLRTRSGAQSITAFDHKGVAALLAEFDPRLYLTRRQVKMLDRLSWAAMAASHQALDDAGHPQALQAAERSGIAVASSYATTGNLLQFYHDLAAVGPQQVNPLWLRNSNPSTLMMLAAIQHKLQGVNLTVSSGEPAGLDGLMHCCNALETNACSVMLLLGCESVWIELQRYLEEQRILAPHSDQSVPYGLGSVGAVLGECAAALVLESSDQVEARGARVLAEVLAVVSRAGDSARALRCALDHAFVESGVQSKDVEFIVGSGNGYPRLDAIEAAVLSEKFEAASPVLTSIKGSIGECLSAAGLASILTVVEAGVEGLLPPIRGLDQIIPELNLPVAKEAAEVGHGVALVTSLGHLGGAAVALLRV